MVLKEGAGRSQNFEGYFGGLSGPDFVRGRRERANVRFQRQGWSELLTLQHQPPLISLLPKSTSRRLDMDGWFRLQPNVLLDNPNTQHNHLAFTNTLSRQGKFVIFFYRYKRITPYGMQRCKSTRPLSLGDDPHQCLCFRKP